MLSNEIKKAINQMIPSTFTVDGITYSPTRTFGSNPLGDFEGPTINVSVPAEGIQYMSSTDELVEVTDTDIISGEAQVAKIRYKIAALDTPGAVSSEITYAAGQQTYKLPNAPVLLVNSIAGFTEGVDFQLDANRETITWLGNATPADGEVFTVDYQFIESGYWIANGIATELRKHILANLKPTLAAYRVDVSQVGEVRDISVVFVRENVFGFTFDVQVVYTYSWSRALTNEDGPLLDQIDNTLTAGDYSETTTFN